MNERCRGMCRVSPCNLAGVADVKFRVGSGRRGVTVFEQGWRRCRLCDRFFQFLAEPPSHCPCCGKRLAVRRRGGRLRRNREDAAQ